MSVCFLTFGLQKSSNILNTRNLLNIQYVLGICCSKCCGITQRNIQCCKKQLANLSNLRHQRCIFHTCHGLTGFSGGSLSHSDLRCQLFQALLEMGKKQNERANIMLNILLHDLEGTFSSVQSLSCVQLFVTPRTAACQASLSITNSQSLLKLVH